MDLFITLVAIVIIVSVVLTLRKRQFDGLKPMPGPRTWPILGNVHQIKPTRLQVTLYEWMQTYGDIFQFTALGQKYVILNSSELIKSVLHKFLNRPFNIHGELIYNFNGPTFNNNIFVTNELKQAFTDVVQDKTMKELSDDQVHELIHTLKQLEGRDVAVNTLIERTATKQILIALIGCRPTDHDIEVVWRYLEAVRDMFSTGAAFVLSTYPWLRSIPGTSFKRLYYLNKTAISEMVKELTETDRERGKNFPGLISLLKKKTDVETEKETLTNMNVHGAVVDVIAGSVGPWFSNIVCGLLCLAKHNTVQVRLHSEMDNVCQNKCPSLADRDELPYLNATILEIFRYFSLLPITVPHLATEDVKINGFTVEKDTVIFGDVFNLHHSENIWNDPWIFRPERFIDDAGSLLSSKDIMPFGIGPRMCKGYPLVEPSIFTCLANILYHFDILPPRSGDLPDHDPKTFKYGATLILPPIQFRFEPRTPNQA